MYSMFFASAVPLMVIASFLAFLPTRTANRPPSLRLPLPLLIHIPNSTPRQTRHEHPHPLPISPVLRILPRRDFFREPRARLEQDQVGHGPEAGPVVVRLREVAGPGVQRHPGGLLGEEIRVPREGPEALGEEAAVEVAGGEGGAGGELGGVLVGFFGVLEVCCICCVSGLWEEGWVG